MRAYKGRRSIAPLTLNLSTRWNRVVNFMAQLLYHQGKYPQYPLNRIQCGSQSQSGHFGGQKKSLASSSLQLCNYEGWNFNSGNYLFTADTK